MDVVYFLGSVNKLSLLAFLVTLGILSYEVHLLKKESQLRTKPKIPKFDGSVNLPTAAAATIITEKQEKVTKPNNLIIIILIALLIIFGLAAFFGFYSYNQKTSQTPINLTPVVNFITSKGIKIYNEQFKLLSDSQLANILPGDTIIIGVETVNDADIDRARIRVNKNNWQTNDITIDFYSQNQIYYIKHKVATDEAKLKIEAQLHSASEGWLGE